jgi:hypothetical protein
MALERSREALRHAQRARNELNAALDRPEEYVYHFRCAVALLMAVGTVVDDEVGPAGAQGWWRPILDPHSGQLMKLRNPVLKQNDPPASLKFMVSGRLVLSRDAEGNPGPIEVVDQRSHPSGWTWDSGPYQGQNVLEVIDLYLELLASKVLPEAERLLSESNNAP